MPALEVISGYVTAPAAGTFVAMTPNGSDSFTIRSFDVTQKAYLLAQWGFFSGVGAFRIRSPRMHDNVQGIRLRMYTTTPDPQYWGGDFMQPLYAQDTTIWEGMNPTVQTGLSQLGCAMIYYPTLPGVSANLISPTQLQQKGMHTIGQDLVFAAIAGPGYCTAVAINSQSGCDNFQANMWYALLGAIVDAPVPEVRIQGVDIGNLGVGIPGCALTPEISSRWFVELSRQYGIPLIPCFNSANKFSIFVSILENVAGIAVNVTLVMVLLGPTITPGQ